jgi:hypothetical protein
MGGHADLGTVNVRFLPQEVFRPNEVVAELVRRFRAHITCHDWYADRRNSTLRTIAWHENAGTPVPNPQVLLDDIDRAEKEGGRRFGIAVPMEGGGYMIGDVSRHGLVLTACCPLTGSEAVKAVVAFLRSVNIVADVRVT